MDFEIGKSYFYFGGSKLTGPIPFYYKVIDILPSIVFPGNNKIVEYHIFGSSRNHRVTVKLLAAHSRLLNPIEEILYG